MRMDARWPFVKSGLLVALIAVQVAAQEPFAPASNDELPRTASEVLAAAAEEAARAKDQRPAEPPPPPEDFAPPVRQEPSGFETPVEADSVVPVVAEEVESVPAEQPGPLPVAAPPKRVQRTAPQVAPPSASGFLGIVPGETTRDQLHEAWGEPEQVSRIPGGVRESYPSDAFDQLRVTLLEDVVQSITLTMPESLPVDKVAERLHVADIEPVEMLDEGGQLLGYVYPESGMVLGFDKQLSRPRVSRIVIEELNAPPFLARAEMRMNNRYGACLDDVARVLRLEPDCGRAFWIEAELMARIGDFDQSVKLLQEAIELEPDELEYRLALAKVFVTTGDHRGAVQQVRDVIDAAANEPVTLAKAYCCWGDCLAAAPERDFKQAIEHHMQAVKMAEPLSKSESLLVRRAAKEVLMDAYLGVAYDIGHGHWQQQATVVPQWLNQALTVADDMIRHERVADSTRLHVYERALAALAGIAEPPDPHPWVRGLTELGAVVVRQAEDEDYQAQLAWRLGVALGDATEIETARQNSESAMKLGNMAMAYFAQGEPVGRNYPNHDYLRGWLCYRIGAIHAIERGDHKQAMAWFEQAVPLLESPTPASSTVNKARHGETFVSMAISYWEAEQQDEALRLTRQGMELMERAAADGQLDKAALAVPYGNLARMHELLGDQSAAQQYNDLATRARALGPR